MYTQTMIFTYQKDYWWACLWWKHSQPDTCWLLRCSWSIACWRCSNYIFIIHLIPDFNGLSKDKCKTRQETFKVWDLVRPILEIWRYLTKVEEKQWMRNGIYKSTETERSSGWQLWYSLETLKTSFNVSSEYQGCHPDDLSVFVYVYQSHRQWFDMILIFS